MARHQSTTTAPEAKASSPQPTEAPANGEVVSLRGRLTADPILRRTASGKAVTTIRIAVNPPQGEATFHSVVVWNRTAEVVCEYLRKGRAVEVTGREQQRSYQASDGTQRTVTEISAHRVQFLSRKEMNDSVAAVPEKEVA